MNKFKAGDIVGRINWNHGKTFVGERYTVLTSEDDKLTFEEVADSYFTYDAENFKLLTRPSDARKQQEIITVWLDKLAYVLICDSTTADFLEIRNKGLLLESDVTNITGSSDIYQYVENTYDHLKSQEIQKKSQKLLEQKEQLAKQLADIEKELENLK